MICVASLLSFDLTVCPTRRPTSCVTHALCFPLSSCAVGEPRILSQRRFARPIPPRDPNTCWQLNGTPPPTLTTRATGNIINNDDDDNDNDNDNNKNNNNNT